MTRPAERASLDLRRAEIEADRVVDLPQAGDRLAGSDQRRRRREYVPAVEHRAHFLREEVKPGDLVDLELPLRASRRHEQAVVRSHEIVAFAPDHQRPAIAAHARVDYGEVSGPRRKVAGRIAKDERAPADVSGRQPVRDVCQPDVRGYAEHDPFHDCRVHFPEVRGYRDDPWHPCPDHYWSCGIMSIARGGPPLPFIIIVF